MISDLDTHPRARPAVFAGPRAGAVAAFLAAAAYSSFLLERWTHPRFAVNHTFISQLELPGQPWSLLYRGSDVLSGAAMVITAAAVWTVLRAAGKSGARVLVATGSFLAAGLSSVADGATTMRCAAGANLPCAVGARSPATLLAALGDPHADSGVIGLVAVAAAAILLGSIMTAQAPVLGRLAIIAGTAIGGLGLLDIALLAAGGGIGTAERARTLLISAWLAAVGIWLLLASHRKGAS